MATKITSAKPVLGFDVNADVIDLIYQQAQQVLNTSDKAIRQPHKNRRRREWQHVGIATNVVRPHTALPSRRSSKAQRPTRPTTAGRKRSFKTKTAGQEETKVAAHATETLPAPKPQTRPHNSRRGNRSLGMYKGGANNQPVGTKANAKRGKAPVSKRMGGLVRWSPAKSSSYKSSGATRLEKESLVEENRRLRKQVTTLKQSQQTDSVQIAKLKHMLAADPLGGHAATTKTGRQQKHQSHQTHRALLAASYRREKALRQTVEQKQREIDVIVCGVRQTRCAELELQNEEYLSEIGRLRSLVTRSRSPGSKRTDNQMDTLRTENKLLQDELQTVTDKATKLEHEAGALQHKLLEQLKALSVMAKRLRTMERVKNNALNLLKSRQPNLSRS